MDHVFVYWVSFLIFVLGSEFTQCRYECKILCSHGNLIGPKESGISLRSTENREEGKFFTCMYDKNTVPRQTMSKKFQPWRCVRCPTMADISSNIESRNHCPIKIKFSKMHGASSPFIFPVSRVKQEVEIILNCLNEQGASYRWTSVNKNGHTMKSLSHKSSLTYVVSKQNTKIWKEFMSIGLSFRCSVLTPFSSQSIDARVQGFQTFDYGVMQTFSCGPNAQNETAYTWRVDGKIMAGKSQATENFTFLYDHPRRFFLECKNEKGTSSTEYTVTMCGREQVQEDLKVVVLYLCPTAAVPLILLALVIRCSSFYKKTDASNAVETSSFPPVVSRRYIRLIPLFVLPACACTTYTIDVITDWMVLGNYVVTGQTWAALATLSLILLSIVVVSVIASWGLFIGEQKKTLQTNEKGTSSKEDSCNDFDIFFNSQLRRSVSVILTLCNFGPLLVHFQLICTNLKLWYASGEKASVLQQRQHRILKLLMKLTIAELLCESLGQGMLQGYILSKELGKEGVCLPDKALLQIDVHTLADKWPQVERNFSFFGVNDANRKMLAGHDRCDCEVWVAKGLDHCFPEHDLEAGGGEIVQDDLSCFIADCSTKKNVWKIAFPIVQIISSLLQISFSLTHLGAVQNLQHLVRVHTRKASLYVLTFFYFTTSLSTALLVVIYLANRLNNPWYVVLACLTILKLILPESLPLQKWMKQSAIGAWAVPMATIILPLMAHMPIYYLMHKDLYAEGSGCVEMLRNRVTLLVQGNQILNRDIVMYSTTAPETQELVNDQLNLMGMFPIDSRSLTTTFAQQALNGSLDQVVINVRNRFNVFGHFFLWSGTLIMIDATTTILYLVFWVVLIRPHEVVKDEEGNFKEEIPLAEIQLGVKVESGNVKEHHELVKDEVDDVKEEIPLAEIQFGVKVESGNVKERHGVVEDEVDDFNEEIPLPEIQLRVKVESAIVKERHSV